MRFLVSILLLIAGVCYAGVATHHHMVVARKNAGGGCSPCSGLGTSEFYWTGDYDADCGGSPTHTEKLEACIVGGITRTGTLDGVTISNFVSESTSTEHDGTWMARITADNQDLHWDINSEDIFNDEAGYISLYAYFTDPFDATVRLLEVVGNNANAIIIFLTGTSYPAPVRVVHEHGNTQVTITSTDTVTTNTWHHIEMKWDITRCVDGDGNCADANEDEVAVRIDDGSWLGDSDTDDAEVWGASSVEVRIGAQNFAAGNNTVYIDDLRIDTSYP